MKNIILPIYAVVIALLVVSCGPSIPKTDKKVAKKACSCFKPYAKIASKQAKLEAKNYEKIVMDSEKNYTEDEKKAFKETDEYKEWNDTRFELRDEYTTDSTCLVNWAKEQGKEFENMVKGDVDPTGTLGEEYCPEVAYLYSRTLFGRKAAIGEKK